MPRRCRTRYPLHSQKPLQSEKKRIHSYRHLWGWPFIVPRFRRGGLAQKRGYQYSRGSQSMQPAIYSGWPAGHQSERFGGVFFCPWLPGGERKWNEQKFRGMGYRQGSGTFVLERKPLVESVAYLFEIDFTKEMVKPNIDLGEGVEPYLVTKKWHHQWTTPKSCPQKEMGRAPNLLSGRWEKNNFRGRMKFLFWHLLGYYAKEGKM